MKPRQNLKVLIIDSKSWKSENKLSIRELEFFAHVFQLEQIIVINFFMRTVEDARNENRTRCAILYDHAIW